MPFREELQEPPRKGNYCGCVNFHDKGEGETLWTQNDQIAYRI